MFYRPSVLPENSEKTKKSQFSGIDAGFWVSALILAAVLFFSSEAKTIPHYTLKKVSASFPWNHGMPF